MDEEICCLRDKLKAKILRKTQNQRMGTNTKQIQIKENSAFSYVIDTGLIEVSTTAQEADTPEK